MMGLAKDQPFSLFFFAKKRGVAMARFFCGLGVMCRGQPKGILDKPPFPKKLEVNPKKLEVNPKKWPFTVNQFSC